MPQLRPSFDKYMRLKRFVSETGGRSLAEIVADLEKPS